MLQKTDNAVITFAITHLDESMAHFADAVYTHKL